MCDVNLKIPLPFLLQPSRMHLLGIPSQEGTTNPALPFGSSGKHTCLAKSEKITGEDILIKTKLSPSGDFTIPTTRLSCCHGEVVDILTRPN